VARDDDLAGWQFEVEEISPGVYNGRGWDGEGRSVEIRSSIDPDPLEKLKAWAREIKDDRPTRDIG
jgi:hypothetical protein